MLWSRILRVSGYGKPLGLNIVFSDGSDPLCDWEKGKGMSSVEEVLQ